MSVSPFDPNCDMDTLVMEPGGYRFDLGKRSQLSGERWVECKKQISANANVTRAWTRSVAIAP
jgi:hypothetical protein